MFVRPRIQTIRPALASKAIPLLFAAGLLPSLGGTAQAKDAFAETAAQMPGMGDILAHTPLWVWPLIAYGLFVGWNRTRDRVVSPWRLLVLPVLITGLAFHNLVVSGISAAGLLGVACGAVAGAFAGAAMARRRPARLLEDGRLALQGDWLPLALIVAIIVFRYASGVALGVNPALAQTPTFDLPNAILSGFFAATMIARTIGTLPVNWYRPASAR
ncbi:MAG: hypothetical protein J0I79_19195 [Mesorhizobium sp.]|uniref:DUF6622 family protein n=1 Tax=Mesorhizobium sp. TaxID=1871066 RepID=UPI001AD1E8F5|nr:DUF6622 family protein [Mesorhizobium sp.]MBN9220076.1 hypothetical protein [Mesorhizobium sp.]